MLDFRITERDRTGLIRIVDFSDGQVEIPINDSRIAKVTVAMESEVAQFCRPLKHMLKVLWENRLVFWGPLVLPDYSFGDGTITLNAHDPSWWWKFSHHRRGQPATASSYPVNGVGFRTLAESAEYGDPAQPTRIWLPGYDGTLQTDEEFAGADINDPDENPDENDVVWAEGRTRGDVVFDSLQSFPDTIGGCDWELQPCDPDHPTPQQIDPDTGVIDTHGCIVQLNTFPKQGVDRTGYDLEVPVPAFHYGWGSDTLADFGYNPDAAEMCNRAIVTEQGGELTDGSDEGDTGIYHDPDSIEEYGVMERWFPGGYGDKKPTLKAIAQATVQAFAVPPQRFSITPKPNTEGAPMYLVDFGVGDIINAVGKRGFVTVDLDGRIVKVTINQGDAANNTTTDVELVPEVVSSAVEGYD